MKTIRLLATSLLATLPPLSAADIKLESLIYQSPTSITIEFTHDGPATHTDFAVERSLDLSPDSWALQGDASITFDPEGTWHAHIPSPTGSPRNFFRVVKDGQPLTAAFASNTSNAAEGGNATATVQFSKPFTGTLRYTLDRGDGSGPQVGEIYVGGASTALIPLGDLGDDTEAGALDYLTLRLAAAGVGTTSYVPVGTGSTIIVEDNDALWGGVLDVGGTDIDLHLRLLTTRQGDTLGASLQTGGAGLLPPNPDGSGRWPFSAFDLSTTTFEGTVGPVVIPADESIYGQPTHLTLALSSAGGGSVSTGKLEGNFALSTTVPNLPHLTFPDRTGTFVFIREGANPKPVEAPTSAPAP